ncbi:hypothetical protein COCNU_09G008340 [Cocos nucifera]|uniref:BAHD acyltransferase n=1 Tax=Cocos nucifera TaxID=13894 RepID=A0A8K0IKY1_COCNU|nr:hypothetical protein COCNU_09G008340 [Cocos nucifera]
MAVENGMPEEAKAESVKVINKTIVLPEKKPEKPTCPLNTFDLPYITFYYNQKLMLYKGGEFGENVGRLKEGLGKVLEYFYPLAGKLRQDEERVLVVDCETPAGAEVVEAAAEGVAVADLAEGEATGLLQELVPYTGVMNLEGLQRPLLAVQFTKLKDGLAIGCSFNHAILDGNSTWHFMFSWAELCRGAPSIAKPKMFYYSDAGFNCVAVGSSPRFKVYDVDFGFGRPERVRSGSNNKFDGMMYLYPGREGGRSIDVELTLQKEAMHNLEKDGEFLMVNAA